MKQILILILTFSLFSCNNGKKTETDFKPDLELKEIAIEEKKDDTHNYWELTTDTITERKELQILDKKFTLELKTFSLNDSLIVRNLAQGKEQAYYDHSHTMVTDISLLTDTIIDQKRIEKTDFKKSLLPEFYAECNLYSTEIDSVKDKTLFLHSNLAVPDTDNIWKVNYSIEIENNRLGDLDVKATEYIGM